MAIDRRKKDVDWKTVDEAGDWYPGDYGGASLAVLMDLRDELKKLNALLACGNFVNFPQTLRDIRTNTTPKRKYVRKAKP